MIDIKDVIEKLKTEWNEIPSVFYFREVQKDFVQEYLDKTDKIFEISSFSGLNKEVEQVLLSVKDTYNIFIEKLNWEDKYNIYYLSPKSKVDETLFHINYKLRKKK
jgi:hypothetical protein